MDVAREEIVETIGPDERRDGVRFPGTLFTRTTVEDVGKLETEGGIGAGQPPGERGAEGAEAEKGNLTTRGRRRAAGCLERVQNAILPIESRSRDYNRRRKTGATSFIDASTLMDMRNILAGIILAAAVAALPSCDNGSVTPVSPTDMTKNEIFSGNLAVGGTNVYSFTTSAAGDVSLLLTRGADQFGVNIPLQIGIGTPQPDGSCPLLAGRYGTFEVGTSMTSGTLTTVGFGAFCVAIVDASSLGPASYTVEVTHPL